MLAGASLPVPDSVPKIEINGEKVSDANSTPVEKEKEEEEGGDVTVILDSLQVNGKSLEKGIGGVSDNGQEGIRPPYGF